MALVMVMTVCVLVYAALAYRIRMALKEHGATLPNQKGQRTQNPTARWVCPDFGGLHGQPFQHGYLCARSLAVETCFPF
jgi:transposase